MFTTFQPLTFQSQNLEPLYVLLYVYVFMQTQVQLIIS